jgi:hypothetical protein
LILLIFMRGLVVILFEIVSTRLRSTHLLGRALWRLNNRGFDLGGLNWMLALGCEGSLKS